MIILGIDDTPDTAAAVMIDGELVAAVGQERIDRVVGSSAFPWGAIDTALDVAGVKEPDVDRVVFGTAFTPSALLRAVPSLREEARKEGMFSGKAHAYGVYQSVLRFSGLHTWEEDASKAVLRQVLKARHLGRAELSLVGHHRAHAEAAFRTQPEPDCLVVTLGGVADGLAASVCLGEDDQLDSLWTQSGLATIGDFRARVTEVLGMTPGADDHKLVDLAGSAEAPPELVEHLRQHLRFESGAFNRVPMIRSRGEAAFWGELRRWTPAQAAAAAHEAEFQAVAAFLRFWIHQTGRDRVAASGRVFADERLCGRLAALDEVDALWVHPHPGFGGSAVGACLSLAGAVTEPWKTAALGPRYEAVDCGRALTNTRTERFKGDVQAELVRLLREEHTVARFDGGMEWGPRGLGYRSVLARADSAHAARRLRDQLSLAPEASLPLMIRATDASRWLAGYGKVKEAARFATIRLPATPQLAQLCPSALQADGTVLPRVVRKGEDPELVALLDAMGEAEGTAALLCLPLATASRPIACTPTDAVETWREAGIDALALGPHLALSPRA